MRKPTAQHRSSARPFARAAILVVAIAAAPPSFAQFGPEQVIETSSGNGPSDIEVADLDGDGNQDLIVARTQVVPALVWYRGLGAGSFGSAQPFDPPIEDGHAVRALDKDGDGDFDLIFSAQNYASGIGLEQLFFYYRNDGGGAFTMFPINLSGFVPGMSLGDFEGDGDDDVFYGNWDTASIYAWTILADGNFGPTHLLTDQAFGPSSPEAGDLDGDGDADVIVSLSGPQQIAWFENHGVGVIATKHVLLQASTAGSANLADLDGDGDLDGLSTSVIAGVSAVHWHRNLGGGTFASAQAITQANAGVDVQAVDLDADGDRDVLVGEFAGAYWFANDGQGSFGARQTIPTTYAVGAVATLDVSGDAEPDVVLGIRSNQTQGIPPKVSWFENAVIGSVGSGYCAPAVPNSTGQSGVIAAVGSALVSVGQLELVASSLPTNKMGIFIASQTQGFVPNIGGGAGTLCLGAPVKRIQPTLFTGAVGGFELELSLATSLGVAVQPGQTWNFQAWHRDVAGSSNLTHGLQIAFVP